MKKVPKDPPSLGFSFDPHPLLVTTLIGQKAVVL
jgi:hypothetical protein